MIISKDRKLYLIPKPKDLYGIKCFACKKRMATELHHMIPSRAYRKKCEEDGLVVGLCHQCHWETHNKVNSGLYHKLKQIAQKVYEKTHTREEWMSRYNKNYLWDKE